ncbi:MAG TPA: CarD family transcriptional regulator [bacterium]|nr:CarD family transcriptional regulator [bacterium]HOL92953.1 CarD family transcriptional regulator [bacterium]HPO99305.1 CarD family transcriptional regulator [bacterium]
MTYQVGDTVVKPGLGICKIKAIRKMQVEGIDQSFYVLQSGEVKVMVPFDHAHAGGLRPLLDAEGVKQILQRLREPLPRGEGENEKAGNYSLEIEKTKEELKHRDPAVMAGIVKTLFYKSKLFDLAKAEAEIYQTALQALADEIAHVEHTTRLKAANQIKNTLTEARKAQKESLKQN